MEWTKIKAKHFLHTDYSLNSLGCLSVLLCLTAHLERMPTRREMIINTHSTALRKLEGTLMEHECTLNGVLLKVLEDVNGIEHKRAVSRGTSNRYNDKKKAVDTSIDTTEKKREDKRREDKNIYKEEIVSVFSYFIQKTGKNFKQNPDRNNMIKKRLKDGYTVDQMKFAIDRFVEDEWDGRQAHLDLVYCLGKQQGKADNLDKWLNKDKKKKVFR